MNTEEQAITNSIKNLVFTGKYERFWSPTKGAGVPQTLFENFQPDTEFLIETKVKEVIGNYEPRAVNVKVFVTAQPDLNGYICTIVYTPINTLEPITIEAIFTRVR